MKKFFLISNQNLLFCNLKPFLLVLLLVAWDKRLTLASLQPFLRLLYRVIRSSLSLLLTTPSVTPPKTCAPDLRVFGPSLDMVQHLKVFLVRRGSNWTLHLRYGLTSAEYSRMIPALALLATISDTNQNTIGLLVHLGNVTNSIIWSRLENNFCSHLLPLYNLFVYDWSI